MVYRMTTHSTALMTAPGDDDPLAELRAVRALRAELERTEAALVRRALNSGVTGVQVAAALGVTKQAVHKKYGGRRKGGQP